jgi:outer membrane receptor protein involved in Fe transport
VETGLFAEDQWQVDPRWRVNFGFHLSAFHVQGVRYTDPQLRLSAEYTPSGRVSLQWGYSRMVQYLHLLTSSSIGLPTDLWVPTTGRVAPSRADQYGMSMRWAAAERLVVDASAYYKDMRSMVSYQEGASFLLREGLLPSSIVDAANWETKITTGQGSAAGLEVQAAWQHARFDLKVNGTLSRSYRQFDDINNGNPFPDRHDRRFTTGIQGTYRFSKKWAVDAQWLFGTGLAITLAESKFFNPGTFFPQVGINYSERNGVRLPAYHRMDLSIHYLLRETEGFYHGLTLNLYNVYNRMNPFYITLVEDPITQEFAYRQFSLFRFFPSISYRFALR